MRRLCNVVNIDSLKLFYSADFHLIGKYGIIFWSNQQNVNEVFILQKRILRIMLQLGYRATCGPWFNQLGNIYCSMSIYFFIGDVCDSTYFKTNFSVHSIHSRQKNRLHKPLVKFTLIKRGITYSAIKVFNKLPLAITQYKHDKKQLKILLEKY
jgi:hypothetical protein